MVKKDRILGGILLVSGTAIGAGMLALPLSTANNGFFPSIAALVICWFFVVLAALLLLEVTLDLSGERDLISMAGSTLGVYGKIVASLAYLLLLYALISVYLQSSRAWLTTVLEKFEITLSLPLTLSIVVIAFGGILSYGTAVVEYINRYLVLGLTAAYVALITCALPSVSLPNIMIAHPSTAVVFSFPLIITAFGFGVVLPSLTNYLDRSFRALRSVVIVGSFVPLVVYFLWELVALGIIPLHGPHSFEALIAQHDNGMGVTLALERISGNVWITHSSRWFSIFAVLTSLLGVSLALFHFLADAFSVEAKGCTRRLFLLVCTYLPPFMITLLYPAAFNRILSLAGIFVAVLLGILPGVMAWRNRYYLRSPPTKRGYQVFGGKILLILVILFFCSVTYWEIANCLFPPSS